MKPINFVEGDFVLVGKITRINKLALGWTGPYRVVRAVSDHLFEVQELCPPYEVVERHASRLKFYSEASRGVTQLMEEQARYTKSVFLVDKLVDIRTRNTNQYEILVFWRGLEDDEATWEPLQNLHEDVPVLLSDFLRRSSNIVARKACEILGISCSDVIPVGANEPRKNQRKGGGNDRESAPVVPKKKLSRKKKEEEEQEQEREPEEEEEEKEAKQDLKKESQRKRRPTPRYISDEIAVL